MTNKRWVFIFMILLFLGLTAFCGVSFLCLNGKIDAFYLRFTVPTQNSFVLGTSRAAQGIQPHIINEDGSLDFQGELYNFSFTGMHSPWGSVYKKAIENKLDPATTYGLFLLEVNPRSISFNRKDNPEEDPLEFRESGQMLDETVSFSNDPNLSYILKFYSKPYYEIITSQFMNDSTFLHNDGWLEISVPMTEKSVQKRKAEKLKTYKNDFNGKYAFSPKRYTALKEVIQMLKPHGRVVLVRMATSPEMLELEKEYMPDFNQKMSDLALDLSIEYLDCSIYSDQLKTTDGNHLWKESGVFVTERIKEMLR